jgi:hypothetical protein
VRSNQNRASTIDPDQVPPPLQDILLKAFPQNEDRASGFARVPRLTRSDF